MGAIFMLSEQPGDTLYLPPLFGIDKLAHLAVYGALAATLIFAFSRKYKEMRPRVVMVVTPIFCLCYGISDEFHQSFVPGRSPSGWDVLADVCGAILVCLFWSRARRNQPRGNPGKLRASGSS
ncbi:MAG: VanZ family protein [Pseudomonadota bacterium]